MTEEMHTNKHTFCFYDGGFYVRLNPKSIKRKQIEFLSVSIVCFLLLAIAIFFYIMDDYGNTIVFGIILILLIGCCIYDSLLNKKREASYLFQVDSDGIKHKDAGFIYLIKWSEICSFGYVKDNVIAGVRSDPSHPCQLCLYFSKIDYSEAKLRMKFDRIESRLLKHVSADQIIVLGFLKNDIPKELAEKINNVILLYCAPQKERSYII